jgi:hypothetical protein
LSLILAALAITAVGERIKAVQPELGESVDGVLFFGEGQWNKAVAQRRSAQRGGDSQQQSGFAHAPLANKQMMLETAVGGFAAEVRQQSLKDFFADRKQQRDFLVRHA